MDLSVNSWQDVLKLLIMLFIAAAGAPVTQWIKISLSKLLKKEISDRPALILTGAVALLNAVFEMWVSGALNFSDVTLQNFPETFFAVFSVATVYYGWLRGSDTVFGRKFALKRKI